MMCVPLRRPALCFRRTLDGDGRSSKGEDCRTMTFACMRRASTGDDKMAIGLSMIVNPALGRMRLRRPGPRLNLAALADRAYWQILVNSMAGLVESGCSGYCMADLVWNVVYLRLCNCNGSSTRALTASSGVQVVSWRFCADLGICYRVSLNHGAPECPLPHHIPLKDLPRHELARLRRRASAHRCSSGSSRPVRPACIDCHSITISASIPKPSAWSSRTGAIGLERLGHRTFPLRHATGVPSRTG